MERKVELAKVLGILRPDSGRIFINGNDVTKTVPEEITAGLAPIQVIGSIGFGDDVSLGKFHSETSGKEPVSKHGFSTS